MSSLPYRAVAFDLDGTLLDPQTRLTSLTLRVLKTLQARGVRILLASGRMSARVMPFAAELGFPMSLIAFNGAEILDGAGSAWSLSSSRTVPPRVCEAVIKLSREAGVFLNVYREGKLYGYHPAGAWSWAEHYTAQNGAEYESYHIDPNGLPRDGVAKLLAMDTPENRDRLFDAWCARLGPECDLTKSNPEYLEVLGKGVSKASALQIWLGREGIPASSLMAFGDAENDLEMLKLAGLGIAMSNATPGLRAAHSLFSRWSHAEEGVAKELIDRFGLDPSSPAG